MNKKVSVIMATYNCEDTVKESIDSILCQTYDNWEFIICDDGSSDNTFEILKEFEKKYPKKIKVIKNEKNSKLPYSLNHCLQYASGEYIARMDADDMSHEERLSEQVDFLDTHNEIDAVGTGMICFDGEKITGVRKPQKNPNSSIIGMGVPFFHATIMMRKKTYDELHGYSLKPYVLRCEDVDLWIRFFAQGHKGENIERGLYYVREDMEAVKRRTVKNAMNTSKTLLKGFRENGYPIKQYVYIAKPIISILIPKKIKYLINKKRWKEK